MKVEIDLPTKAALNLLFDIVEINPDHDKVEVALVSFHGPVQWISMYRLATIINEKVPHVILFGPCTINRKDLQNQVRFITEANIS